MRVNGEAFRRAREELRKNAGQQRGARGEPALGTQEWLASRAKIKNEMGEDVCLSVRTIQYLEKGNASIQTIDAVSPYLGLNGRELILGYGQDNVVVDAPGIVDFRPYHYPREEPKTFHHSPFLVSIDPLIITLKSGDLDCACLQSISARLKIGAWQTELRWIYRVFLSPAGQGWLGIVEDVYAQDILIPKPYRATLMFNQLNYPQLSWHELVSLIETCEDKLIQLMLICEFQAFIKEIKIGLSCSQLKLYFKLGRQKHQSKWPFFVQTDALIWQD